MAAVTAVEMEAKLQEERVKHQAELKQMKDDMEASFKVYLEGELKKVRDEAAAIKDQKDDKKNKKDPDLTGKKSFQKIPTYSGNHEEYEDWKFKWIAFLSDEPQIQEVLQETGKKVNEPTEEDIKAIMESVGLNFVGEEKFREPEVINREVYQALCMNLGEQSNALDIMKNLTERTTINGILGWWKLGREVNAMTSQRLQGLASKVYSPKRVKTYAEVLTAMEQWEMNVKLFERSDENISKQTKLWSIRQIVPEELEIDIIKNNSLISYDDVRAYIIEQVSSRRDRGKDRKANGPVMEDAAKKLLALMTEQEEPETDNQADGGDECRDCQEESQLNQLMSFIKGSWGKGGGKGGKGDGGKGKGGGKFNGYCHHCGGYGHRINECYKKDREMEAFRKGGGQKGGGKGFDGGKSYGGGGGYGKGGYGKGGYGDGGYGKGGDGKGKGMFACNNSSNNWWEKGNQPQIPQTGAWTLSLARSVTPPPGLAGHRNNMTAVENPWSALQTDEDDDFEENSEEMSRMMEVANMYNGNFPEVPMGNYSKGSRKFGCKRIDMRKPKPMNLFVKENKGPVKELNAAISYKTIEDGWMKIKSAMDSGATSSVAHPSMCPQYKIEPSEGSKAGLNYISASGDLMPNLGEQLLDVAMLDGKEGKVLYQMADVERPLNSVSEICDAGGAEGQYVIFGRSGGAIVNLSTGRQTPFKREDGIYNLEFWVKPRVDSASGFPRQGTQ